MEITDVLYQGKIWIEDGKIRPKFCIQIFSMWKELWEHFKKNVKLYFTVIYMDIPVEKIYLCMATL